MLQAYIYTNASPNRPIAVVGVRPKDGMAVVVHGALGADGELSPLYDSKTHHMVRPADGEDYLHVMANTYQNAYMWVDLHQGKEK